MRQSPLLLLMPLLACGPTQEDFDGLEKRVSAIEARTGDADAAEAEDKEVIELVQKMMRLGHGPDQGEAKEIWAQLKAEHADSPVMADERVLSFGGQLDVVGTKVSKLPEPTKWFVGNSEALDVSSGATLVLFWEMW